MKTFINLLSAAILLATFLFGNNASAQFKRGYNNVTNSINTNTNTNTNIVAKDNDPTAGLYLKSCETVSTGFEVCKYCTDKELTNCKEYWCSGGSCQPAPKSKMPIDSVVPKNAQNYQVTTYNGVPYISYQINDMQNIVAPFQDTYVSVGYDAKPVSAGNGLGALNCTLDAIGKLETCAGKKGATEADKEACHKTFENDIAACKGSKTVIVIGKKQ